MSQFRYRAVRADGASVEGVVDANDRKSALRMLGERGLYPSRLEGTGDGDFAAKAPAPKPVRGATHGGGDERGNGTGAAIVAPSEPTSSTGASSRRVGASGVARDLRRGARGPAAASAASASHAASGEAKAPAAVAMAADRIRVKRKEITALTRELSALLGAAIPIPQALDGLAEEEENPALRAMVAGLAEGVRKGASLSSAMEAYPKVFTRLYVSMVRVGEEAGALPRVMEDLANLLEHEDEVRSEVRGAVAYPAFVLGFGLFTVLILLTVVLPRLFGMLQEMLDVLPLPTLILLKVSQILSRDWPWILAALGGAGYGGWRFLKSERGAESWDALRLRLPLVGAVFRSAALGRFARTLGTLAKSGVSLLPALRIVEDTIGNRILAKQIARVSEETRGGDSLAAPLRKMGVFPRGIIQMIEVGEETGRLDEMLLKIAQIEERHMRAKTKTLVSLLAPALILVVGALVGFMVIALLLPIFKMSRAIH
ncbi:MAG: type II secretion system F family protein [Verrucomicrobiales bacterium]|nr:type II secretion system F family protein [Verrucomicrobiales bacterium]